MNIRITEPPKYRGLLETVCNQCGLEIVICETTSGATIVLDERPVHTGSKMTGQGVYEQFTVTLRMGTHSTSGPTVRALNLRTSRGHARRVLRQVTGATGV
jgi:hypothetical protein